MVVPPLHHSRSSLRPHQEETGLTLSPGERKAQLRNELRQLRRKAAGALSPAERALILFRPPNALLSLFQHGATVGLYHAMANEVPAQRLARWFSENGYPIALPRFATRDSAMEFAVHTDPFGETDLEPGPFGQAQPLATAQAVVPDVALVPLLGFTLSGDRIGQGAGHYDRWLASHPDTLPIGLAWDIQEVDDLPTEPHDAPLHAVLTPTRLVGPFA